MRTIYTLLLLLFLSNSVFGLAYPELPFLIFSDAVLSLKTQEVLGYFESGDYRSFPVLSYQPPKVVKKKSLAI